jgi:hypothetical protein
MSKYRRGQTKKEIKKERRNCINELNYLTPMNRVALENVKDRQPVKIFSAFYLTHLHHVDRSVS